MNNTETESIVPGTVLSQASSNVKPATDVIKSIRFGFTPVCKI